MILAVLALGVVSWIPLHHRKAKPTEPPVSVQQSAAYQDAVETAESVIDQLPDVQTKFGTLVPQSLYDALNADIGRIAEDKLTDLRVLEDDKKINDDLDALNAQIDWILSHRRI